MSDESNDAVVPGSGTTSSNHESNGTLSENPKDLAYDVVMLRARCSNLRHWCRLMLEDPAATGVLPEATVTDLLWTTPEVSEPEGQVVVALLARGGNIPPNHPLAPSASDAVSLKTAVSQLSAERERLRQAFFTLYDHLHPDDDLTEEYFLELISQGPGRSISELIADFEREGVHP
ncbi:MAG TPA: hypothetical protein VG097_06880 [Gemmata sp.]|jgi:hypothetical protein|nr:hypothetical protein [Gemmata sp.]